jgi:hypothetical protein
MVRYGPSGVWVNPVYPGYMPPVLNATNAGERACGALFLASDEALFVNGAANSSGQAVLGVRRCILAMVLPKSGDMLRPMWASAE